MATTQLKPKQVQMTKEISFVFDGGGSTPTTGLAATFRPISFHGTIKSWYLVGDPDGSCVIDVVKAAGAKPTAANTIAGSEKPTLSSAGYNSDTTLSTWTVTVAPGDVLGVELDSVTTCTNIVLVIVIEILKNY